jgi:hypothetical protein
MEIHSNPLNCYLLNTNHAYKLNGNSYNLHVNQPVQGGGPNLDKLTLSSFQKGYPAGGIKIERAEKTVASVYYYDYFSVEDMTGLTEEEKNRINEAIRAATTIDPNYFSGGSTSDQFAMAMAQMKAKLDFVAEHLVPEQFKDQMMQATNQFINDKFAVYNDQMLKIQQAIYDTYKDQSGPMKRIAESALQQIQAIKDGNSVLQKEQTHYLFLFSELNGTDAGEFVQKYEDVMRAYQADQEAASHGDAFTKKRVDRNIHFLREMWNEFIDRLSGFDQYRVSTEEIPLIDQTV